VTGIDVEEKSVDRVGPGENLVIKIKGIEEDDVHGFFLLLLLLLFFILFLLLL
jgi:hypothetical protein